MVLRKDKSTNFRDSLKEVLSKKGKKKIYKKIATVPAQVFFCEFCEIFKNTYSLVPNNTGGLNKKGSPTNNLNINKRRGPNKALGGGLENVLGQKWQPVI